jgi:hypothetical protein
MVADANSSYGEVCGRWCVVHRNSYSLVVLLCIPRSRNRRLWKGERPGKRDDGKRKRKRKFSPHQSSREFSRHALSQLRMTSRRLSILRVPHAQHLPDPRTPLPRPWGSFPFGRRAERQPLRVLVACVLRHSLRWSARGGCRTASLCSMLSVVYSE